MKLEKEFEDKSLELEESDFNEAYKDGFADGYDMGKDHDDAKLMTDIHMKWILSDEYTEANIKWITRLIQEQEFDVSAEFANARHVFRKRMNS